MDKEKLPAEAHDLGELVAEYETITRQKVVTLGMIAVVFVSTGLAVILGTENVTAGVLSLGFGLFMAIGAVRASWDVRTVYVFTEGLINTGTGEKEVVKWDDVARAKLKCIVYRSTTKPYLLCTLQLRSGLILKYVYTLEQALQFCQHVHNQFTARSFGCSYKREREYSRETYYMDYNQLTVMVEEQSSEMPWQQAGQLTGGDDDR